MSEFVALRVINAPNSYARAYNPGDEVTAYAVENWGLVIGQDVDAAEDYRPARPADDAPRADWERFVVARGTSPEDAQADSLDGLRARYEPDPEPEPPAHDLPANAAPEGVDGTGWQNASPVTVPSPAADPANSPDDSPRQDVSFDVPRPAESAKKADWIDYVVGSDPNMGAWARSDDTTKADLIAWEPGGDGS